MTQLLIEELSPSQCNIIQETTSDGGNKNVWLSGIFMQADIKNRNQRRYPLGQISNAISEAHQRINDMNGIFGELDHPKTLTINLDRISHVITDLRLEGNNAYGRAKILPTPMGTIAKTLIESGVKIGVSSRGAGDVDGNGDVSNFMFVTVDIVATPSAPGALPSSIYESLELVKSGRQVVTLAEALREDVSAQSYFEKAFKKFLSDVQFQKK